MNNIDADIKNLAEFFDTLEEERGGDIKFYSPITESELCKLEKLINYRLPDIFRWFYTNKSNGIEIDNKVIFPIYNEADKKTFVENIARLNDPSKDLYFKGRPHIYGDYLIVGRDFNALICISKKYNFPNPLLYSCSDPNSSKGVNFHNTDLNLEGLIRKMIKDTFEAEEKEWDLI